MPQGATLVATGPTSRPPTFVVVIGRRSATTPHVKTPDESTTDWSNAGAVSMLASMAGATPANAPAGRSVPLAC